MTRQAALTTKTIATELIIIVSIRTALLLLYLTGARPTTLSDANCAVCYFLLIAQVLKRR